LWLGQAPEQLARLALQRRSQRQDAPRNGACLLRDYFWHPPEYVFRLGLRAAAAQQATQLQRPGGYDVRPAASGGLG
jgi:hypothetical protein